MTIEVTPINPKSYPVSKDLGLSVIPPLGDADTRKRKKNARYKKGTKPEEREPAFGSAVYRI